MKFFILEIPEIPKIKPWEYFNSGFIIANKTHEEFFDKVLQYYHDNVDKFIHAKSFHVGNDQTPLNYFTKKKWKYHNFIYS